MSNVVSFAGEAPSTAMSFGQEILVMSNGSGMRNIRVSKLIQMRIPHSAIISAQIQHSIESSIDPIKSFFGS